MRLASLQKEASHANKDVPNLVFLHAYPLNSAMWLNQFEALADKAHQIAPDFRGYGNSLVDEQTPFSFSLFAEDLRETLDALEVQRAILVGCSMGGYAIFEFWRRYPERVQAMILCDTRADADNESVRQRRAEQIRQIETEGSRHLAGGMAQMLLGETTRSARPVITRKVEQWASVPAPSVLVRTLQALAQRPDSRPTLGTITVPVLVIVGEEDKVTPVELSRSMVREIAGARLVTVPQAGHLSPLENPKAVSSAIGEFLAEVG
jgi:3-oxoadipate enol-lactonase